MVVTNMITKPVAYKGEKGYLDLVADILTRGVDTPDRTSIGQCRKVFNATLWFDLRESLPAPTVRPVPARWAFEELWFFMSGSTNTKLLEEKGITLWKGNTSKDFLRDRGLESLSEGDMGLAYGYQWRNFGGEGRDQLEDTIRLLKEDPYSRRIITTFWNPADSSQMALLPCFYEHKFNVEKGSNGGEDVLHLSLRSRSCDAPFGLPFNYTQYGLYLAAMAKLVGMTAGTLVINIDDCHVYENQIDWCKELIKRDYYPPVTCGGLSGDKPGLGIVSLDINKDLNTMDDLVSLRWGDLEIKGLKVNKKPFVNERPEMAI